MKYVRVDVPIRSPEGTLKLAKKTVKKHTDLGVNSPLTGFVDMVLFESKRASAEALQEAGDKADGDAQEQYQELCVLCGIAKGQTSQTEGTLLWFVLQIRGVLLAKHKGLEETLQQYGYNVVISQVAARKYVRVDIPDKNRRTC